MKVEKRVTRPDLLRALTRSWSADTAALPEYWTPDNPSWGHCAVTALIIQEFFGGKIVRVDLSTAESALLRKVRSHYFNEFPDESVWDTTAPQFMHTPEYWDLLPKAARAYRTRQELLAHAATEQRYKELRYRLGVYLSGSPSISRDPIFRECLKVAFGSGCAKGRYGSIIRYPNGQYISACNDPIDALRAWCDPSCIRLTIPSRQDSMIGACLHAEESVLKKNSAQGRNMQGAIMYVAGVRSNGLFFVKSDPYFTCIRCAVALHVHGAEGIYVPLESMWGYVSTLDALKQAREFAEGFRTLP